MGGQRAAREAGPTRLLVVFRLELALSFSRTLNKLKFVESVFLLIFKIASEFDSEGIFSDFYVIFLVLGQATFRGIVMRLVGFEPTTYCSVGSRSIQLIYRRKFKQITRYLFLIIRLY